MRCTNVISLLMGQRCRRQAKSAAAAAAAKETSAALRERSAKSMVGKGRGGGGGERILDCFLTQTIPVQEALREKSRTLKERLSSQAAAKNKDAAYRGAETQSMFSIDDDDVRLGGDWQQHNLNNLTQTNSAPPPSPCSFRCRSPQDDFSPDDSLHNTDGKGGGADLDLGAAVIRREKSEWRAMLSVVAPRDPTHFVFLSSHHASLQTASCGWTRPRSRASRTSCMRSSATRCSRTATCFLGISC